MRTHRVLVICIALLACKTAAQKEQEERQKEQEERLRTRPDTIRHAHTAADKHAWEAALDALDTAAAIAPLSAEEMQLHKLWEFRRVLDMYCAGKVDDLLSGAVQLPDAMPPGLDAATLAQANQLLARRKLIQQLRQLHDKQQELSKQANHEPATSEECDTAIRGVQSARTVTLNILRKFNSDYGPGIYEVQDSTGHTAHLTTTDSTFTTTGWATITAYAFDDNIIIELSEERRAKAQACLEDRQKAGVARTEFATSSKLLDARLAAMSSELVASCVAPAAISDPAPPPPESPIVQANPPSDAAAASQVAPSIDTVQSFVKGQAASLTTTGATFVESFDANAVAFFPQSLTVYEGRGKIIEGSRDAWGHGAPDKVDASDVVVGLFPNFAWATSQWKITIAGSRGVLPVRVTEVLTNDALGLRVVAASFSIPPSAGVAAIGDPAPSIAAGTPPARDPDSWLASPSELAKHVRNDGATAVVGSDYKEFVFGAEESRKLLSGWKNVKLEVVGNVRSFEGAGYRVVMGYVRWREPKPTLFRVFGLFVRGEAMVGPAPWELATAQYSVAVPASEPQIATAVATAPESTCTIAALACDRFSTNGQTGKKLHALVFAAEQAGRHAAAICLARSNLTSSDKWLAGAANFDTSRAWDGLGCHAQAIAAIEASLAVRPHDQGGWKETCDQCRKIGGACAACDDSPRLARSNSTAATVDRGETGSNTSDPPPVWVSLVQDPPRVFEVWEAGKKVMDGPGGIQVAPGHPRTIVIKGQGWKDKTLIVDGRNERVEFKLELTPDCKSTLADPKSADCRARFCEGHADDARCHSE